MSAFLKYYLPRGDKVYNTEGVKDSKFIDAKVVLGSQQLLIKVESQLS